MLPANPPRESSPRTTPPVACHAAGRGSRRRSRRGRRCSRSARNEPSTMPGPSLLTRAKQISIAVESRGHVAVRLPAIGSVATTACSSEVNTTAPRKTHGKTQRRTASWQLSGLGTNSPARTSLRARPYASRPTQKPVWRRNPFVLTSTAGVWVAGAKEAYQGFLQAGHMGGGRSWRFAKLVTTITKFARFTSRLQNGCQRQSLGEHPGASGGSATSLAVATVGGEPTMGRRSRSLGVG